MPVTLIFYLFYLEGHITRKFTLKNKNKSMDKKLDTLSTLGTDHLTWRGVVMVFRFVQKFFLDNTRVRIKKNLSCKARIFFPEFIIRLYDKNSESDYLFFLLQNQNIFFSNIGNQNIFLEKNHNPPQVKWSFP